MKMSPIRLIGCGTKKPRSKMLNTICRGLKTSSSNTIEISDAEPKMCAAVDDSLRLSQRVGVTMRVPSGHAHHDMPFSELLTIARPSLCIDGPLFLCDCPAEGGVEQLNQC